MSKLKEKIQNIIHPDTKRSSQLMLEMCENIKGMERVKLNFFLQSFRDRSYGFLFMIFCLPSMFPGFLPPLPSFLAIPLIILAIQLIWGIQSPILPNFIANKSFGVASFTSVMQKASSLFIKIEKKIKPRHEYMVKGKAKSVMSVFILLLSFSILIPLPLTNFFPSLAIILFSIAIIERDGLLAIFAYIIGTAGLIIASGGVYVMFVVGKKLVE